MRRAQRRKYHYIYKTTNILNGKYYIGMHSTDNLEDGYIGSGKRLWYSINKHGRENHVKEILEFLPNRKSLVEREIVVVNREMLNDSQCLNLKPGGSGGFSNQNHQLKAQKSGANSYVKRLRDDAEFAESKREQIRNVTARRKELGLMKGINNWNGKKHSEETKLKMSASLLGKQDGEKNSQFGTCWIFNDVENIAQKISAGDLPLWIDRGWRRGRK